MLTANQLILYSQQQPLTKAFDWQIQTKQIWGILGANAVGKTTLLHTVAGLNNNYSGEILLDEQNIKDYQQRQLAQKIGILLQESNDQFPYCVQELLLLARFPHQSAWQSISKAEQTLLESILVAFELIKLQSKSITELSGGERRRVELAMLAMQQPDIYLLDEPTNHLDIKHQIKTLNYFCNLDKTIVMTLHDINLAQQFCSHILLFNHEQVITGTAAEVLTLANLKSAFEQGFDMVDSKWFMPSIF